MKKISTLVAVLIYGCLSSSLFSQLSFTSTPSSGCKPLVVTFTNTSNYPDAYYWYLSLGNGDQIYLEGYNAFTDTAFTYTGTGYYYPYLHAYDASWNYLGYFNGNPISVIGGVSISAPDSACPGESVSFNYYYPANSVLWDFGDGNTSTNSFASNAYSSTGNYNVKLIVNTDCGNDTLYKTINISNTIYPDPSFGFYNNYVCPNTPVTFYSVYNHASYFWNFGDGSTSDFGSTSHSYGSVGTFYVTFTATNGCGLSASKTDSVFIVNTSSFDANAVINFQPASICPNESVSFWAPYNGTKYVWNFGDGSPLDTTTYYYHNHSFTSLGNFNVFVQYFDGCGNDTTYSTTVPVVNSGYFESSVTLSNSSPACPGSSVLLNTDYGYNTYVWNYGDGSPVDSVNQNNGYYAYHIYPSLGTYTASVTIYNGCGTDTTLYTSVIIDNTQPISNYVSANNSSPSCPGENVYLSADYGFDAYVWNYGDGSPIDSIHSSQGGYYVNHVYNSIGTYNASVTIYNSCGNDTTLYTSVNINNTAPFSTSVYFYHYPYEGICPNDMVTFSTESGYSYEWNFGDGSPVLYNTENYLQHAYTTAGTYNASVKITNSCGKDTTLFLALTISNSASFPNYVELYSNYDEFCPGQGTYFYLNYAGSSYVWNMGDGSSPHITNSNSRYYTFTSTGTRTVSVTVTNNCGNDTTLTKIVNVTYPPFQPLTVSNSGPACPGEAVSFFTQHGYYKYIWNFGDGSPQKVTFNNGSYNHSYNDTGTYMVSVRIFQNCGVDPYQYPNLYHDTVIYGTVVIGNNVGFSQNVTFFSSQGMCSSDFNLNASAGHASYYWSFGDGSDTITTNAFVSHSYSAVGNYNPSVTITNHCGIDTTVSLAVNVSQVGYGQFMAYCSSCDPADPMYDPNVQQFFMPIQTQNTHGSDIWAWGYNYVPSICPGQSVYLNMVSGVYYQMGGWYDNQIYMLLNNVKSVVWNYGDGSPTDSLMVHAWQNEIYTSHTYNTVGSDTFSIKLYHKCGNDTTVYGVIEVDSTLGFPNSVSFQAYDNPCVNQSISFGASSGYISYKWNFGDGSPVVTTSGSNTMYQYSSPGTYNASVTITNHCGKDTVIYKQINVVDYKPFPEWTVLEANPTDPCPGENVNFYVDAGWEVASYTWNFGDGSNPVVLAGNNGMGNYISKAYSQPGNYTASVTVTNLCGNDTTISKTINVVTYKSFPGNIYAGSNQTNVCPGDNVQFNASYGYASYQWNFGNGQTGSNSPYVSHTYTTLGTYQPYVTITNFCGNDTTVSAQAINVIDNLSFGPYTPFGQPWYLHNWPNLACPNQNISFYAPYGLPYYIWNFGDGNIDSTSNFHYINHSYASTGNYTIGLTMRNNCGKDTTLYTSVTIDNNLGFQNLYMGFNPNTACPGQSISINGPYGYAYYVFDYGDGSPSDSLSNAWANHSYSSAGTYNVSLKIYNHCGQVTSISSPVTISNNVSFTYAPWVDASPNPNCPGQQVQFYTENGHASYVWNFGDGSIASGSSGVKHSFDTVGNYNVKVKITNHCGSDTTVSTNVVISDTISVIPDTSIFVSPTVSCPGDMVKLSTGGGYVSYLWKFGDGDSLLTTGNNVQHIYSSTGTYSASVKITNGCGFSKTIYKTITVNSSTPVDSALSVSIPFSPNCPGDEVFFNIINGTGTYHYHWNFGDSSSDTTIGTGIQHIYSDTGNFNVVLTATNGCGNSKTLNVVANIGSNVYPSLNSNLFGHGTGQSSAIAGCPGDAILFWYAGTLENSWDFGDGTNGVATEQVMTNSGTPITAIKHIYDTAGTYTVKLTLTNSCGNTVTDSIQVKISGNNLVNGNIFIAPPTGSSGYTTCMNITMIGTGGATYSWNFGDNDTITTISPTISHTYSQPGTYTVKLKVTNGCGYSATYLRTITVNGIGGPDVMASSTPASCFGGNNGSATVTVNSGVAPFTYQWSASAGSQTSATANNLTAGTYSVAVTDAIGCASTVNVNVSEPSDMVLSYIYTNSSCGASDGSAEVLISGGSGGPYSFLWSSGSTDSLATNLAAGNYTVTVTSFDGCTKVGNASVNNGNAAAVSVANATNVGCFGESSGSVDISVSGGTSPYTYLWSNGATTEDLTNLAAGTYTLSVTDDASCVSAKSVTITQPGKLALSTSVVNANCGSSNGSATVNPSGGTAPFSYLWDDNTGYKTTQTVTGLPAGTYQVIVTDSQGCLDSVEAVINNANAPNVTAVVNGASCFGMNNGSVQQTVTGGTNPYSYTWSTGAQTKNVNNLAPGTYFVQIKDASNCIVFRTYTITQPNALTANASSVSATCGNADGTATVTHSGGNTAFTYLWSNGQTTATATGLAAGSYGITVTDNKGCTANTSVMVSQPSTFPSTAASDSVKCFGGNNGMAAVVPAGGNAPYTYLWATSETTDTIFGLTAGTYLVTITDVNNCVSANSVNVKEPVEIVAGFTTNAVTCFGGNDGSATVVASGGTPPYSFIWDNNTTQAQNINLESQRYYVTVTDANNCSVNDSVFVNSPLAISSNMNITDVACFGNVNGSISANPAGGTSPYTFAWSNSSTSQNLTGLAPGMYYVTITDDNNCIKEDSAYVGEPAQLTSVINSSDMSCFGICDGMASVVVSGGTTPYTYLWNNGANSSTIDSLCAGFVSVNISDAHNCQVSKNATIDQPASLSLALSLESATCNNQDGSAIATASGGTPPYSYLWSTGSADSTVVSLSAGAVSVSVTDDNGCVLTALDTVSTNVPPVDICLVTVDDSNTKNQIIWEKPAVNYIDSFRVYRDIVGIYTYLGSVAYSDLSKFVDTTNNINPAITSYKYKISAKDNCGNLSLLSDFHKTIHLTTNLGTQNTINLIWTPYEGFGGANFYYRIGRDSTGSGNYQIIDSVSNSNFTYTDLNPPVGSVNYVVEVVHPFGGCLAELKAENHNSSRSNRGQTANPGVLSATTTSVSATSGCNGSATVNATGGVSPYSYQWSSNANSQTTQTATSLCAGNYSVTVTDNIGNTVVASVSVTLSGSTLSASATATDQTQGTCDGTATVIVNGGTTPYSYVWDTNPVQTDSTATGLCAGTYTVTVTDAVGSQVTASATVGVAPGISENLKETQMLVYPNPNKGQFTVSATGNENYRITVFNIIGEMVYINFDNTGSTVIDLSSKGSGIYFVQILNSSGTINKRVVVE